MGDGTVRIIFSSLISDLFFLLLLRLTSAIWHPYLVESRGVEDSMAVAYLLATRSTYKLEQGEKHKGETEPLG